MSTAPTSRTILVVDDEYAIVEALSEVLLWHGHRVLTAGDGLEALQLMSAERPHLVLLDVMMPRMDGIQLVNAMSADAALAKIAIVLLTAVPGAVPAEMAARLTVLRKPFGLDGLLQAIDKALAAIPPPASTDAAV